jgi:carboxypeptidase family protein
MIARLIVAALAMLLISAQVAAAQPAATPAPGSGTLEGIVTRGPLAPLERMGVPNSTPVAEAQLEIADSSGKVVATAQSASDGSYSVDLPIGTYAIRVVSPASRFGKHYPATVTIAAGQRAHLDIQIDTGIR